MGWLKRLAVSLRGQGWRITSVKLKTLFVDHWFDIRYGLDTCSWAELDQLTIPGNSKEHGYRYQPARVIPLRKLFNAIEPTLPAERVLVDFGSGKGRVLLIASEFAFQEVRGVEFARELCESARRNCSEYKLKSGVRTEFKVIEADATQYAVEADENVFVLYNPFDGVILSKVLDNIARSVQNHPRKILVIYYNPRWSHVIEQRKDFVRVQNLSFWGYQFTLYANRDQMGGDPITLGA